MEKILIGKITSPVGLKGEAKVYNYSDRTQVYEETEKIIVGDTRMGVERLRQQKNMLVIKFEGVDTRDAAEALRNTELFVDREDLPELEEGEIYLMDLIGMDVYEEGPGSQLLGEVTDVIQNTSQDLIKVARDDGSEMLIPFVDPIVTLVDEAEGRIEVDLPEGLLDL